MPATLKAARAQYDVEGYAIFRQVLDNTLIEDMRRHVAWLIEQHPEERPEQFNVQYVAGDPLWHRIVSDARLLDIAEQFIGPDIALFASHYICKPPREGRPVLWHQDGSYWPLDPMDVVTLWVAVDESTLENGCMRIIPRTQHLDLQKMVERRDVDNVLNSSIASEFVDESRAVDVVLRPGDVSVHHPNAIHGSEGNFSDRRRCGLTIRYIPTTTRITNPSLVTPYLLRGNAVPGINDYAARPKYDPRKHILFQGFEEYR